MNPAAPTASSVSLQEQFDAALAQGRFLIQQCRDCGSFGFPPAPRCVHCDADALRWVEPSGRGHVYSVGLTLAVADPALPPLALIELEEGPRLPGRVLDVEPEDLVPGLAVSAHVGMVQGLPTLVFYNKEQGSKEW